MKLYQIFIFLILSILKVQSLSLCLKICGPACFAAPTKAFCMALCMSACAAGTRNCFSYDTTLQVEKNNTIGETFISNVKENDKVLTLKKIKKNKINRKSWSYHN